MAVTAIACVAPIPSPSRAPSPATFAPSAAPTAFTTELTPVPTAPTLTPSDPCPVADLAFTGRDLGAGLGSAAFAVTVTNVSAAACGVAGYPRIVLLALDGSSLPTTWTPAVDGAMLFPAVRVQIVELRPGDAATFAVGYADNPSGPDENIPYEQACPASAGVRVFLPWDDAASGIAPVASGPCDGAVSTSPFVRGTEPPRQ